MGVGLADRSGEYLGLGHDSLVFRVFLQDPCRHLTCLSEMNGFAESRRRVMKGGREVALSMVVIAEIARSSPMSSLFHPTDLRVYS